MRIWKDKYRDWAAREFDGMRYHPWQSSTNQPEDVLFVRVCSFTFAFFSEEEVQQYLDYYSKKIHPSSAISNMNGSHWEFQTQFDELPLYLREEPKRKQVVKALSEAIIQFGK
jgi:hypothetical protein